MNAELEYSRIKTNNKPNKIKVRKPLIGMTLVLLFSFAAGVLLIEGILLRTELAKQNDVNLTLLQQINELDGDNTKLRIEYESGIDLSQLEEKATEKLGMIKPRAYQIRKTEYTEKPTETVTEENKKDISLSDLISIITELFL